MTMPLHYRLEALAERETFSVTATRPSGITESVGTIRHFYIRHMESYGWEANGPDGHLAVHEHRWQALWALTWNRVGYPFPLHQSREREVFIHG